MVSRAKQKPKAEKTTLTQHGNIYAQANREQIRILLKKEFFYRYNNKKIPKSKISQVSASRSFQRARIPCVCHTMYHVPSEALFAARTLTELVTQRGPFCERSIRGAAPSLRCPCHSECEPGRTHRTFSSLVPLVVSRWSCFFTRHPALISRAPRARLVFHYATHSNRASERTVRAAHSLAARYSRCNKFARREKRDSCIS